MVQRRVTGTPTVKPVTVDAGNAGDTMVAVPDTILHAPVPVRGVFPARTVVVALHRFWSGPALADVGLA